MAWHVDWLKVLGAAALVLGAYGVGLLGLSLHRSGLGWLTVLACILAGAAFAAAGRGM